ncbi:MAG TPA: ferrochelatase [Actinomycetota bacterium]|nr:ferrochelatase [Actinomycetota bacterium]
MAEPIGLLVMHYGTPSGPDDVERYYTDIRGGRRPSPEALEDLRRRYAAIGNTFPLARITQQQAEALENELNAGDGPRVHAYIGAKHSPPFVADAVAEMRRDGVSRGVGLVLAPHYSRMSIGGYIDRARRAAEAEGPRFTFIQSWHDHPAFLDVLAERVRQARERLTEDERRSDLVLLTAHSLPARIADEGDPYPGQLRATAEAVAGRLGLERFGTAWQSAGRTPEPWLGPPLEEVVEKAAADGHAAVVVCPCGFTADHLEILYDIDIEARGVAGRAGIRLERTESMNADPAFIRALAEVVRDHVGATERG